MIEACWPVSPFPFVENDPGVAGQQRLCLSLAVLQRTREMGSGEDSRPVDLIQPILSILEGVRMNSVGENQAIDGDVHLLGVEEPLHQARQY